MDSPASSFFCICVQDDDITDFITDCMATCLQCIHRSLPVVEPDSNSNTVRADHLIILFCVCVHVCSIVHSTEQ